MTQTRKAIFVPEDLHEAISKIAAKNNRKITDQLRHDYLSK